MVSKQRQSKPIHAGHSLIYAYMCPQVGNCVARRNYRYFYLFLTTIAVTGVYMMACNITVIVLGRHGIIICVLECVCVGAVLFLKPRRKWDLEMRSRPTPEDILTSTYIFTQISYQKNYSNFLFYPWCPKG